MNHTPRIRIWTRADELEQDRQLAEQAARSNKTGAVQRARAAQADSDRCDAADRDANGR